MDWVYNLISPDEVVRHEALAWHQELLREDREQTIQRPLEAFFHSRDTGNFLARARYAPFAVLYLRWEVSFPDEWRMRGSYLWSPWTMKEALLGEFERGGIPEAVQPQLAELVLDALQRPYRCKDWKYALQVRHVADAEFISEVEALLDAADPLTSLRARFILHVADNASLHITRKTWLRWLEAHGQAKAP